jgi:hypothetical protein
MHEAITVQHQLENNKKRGVVYFPFLQAVIFWDLVNEEFRAICGP